MERKILVTVIEPLNIVANFKKEIASGNAEILTYQDGDVKDHKIWLIGTIEQIKKMLKKVVKKYDGEYTITMSIDDYENAENEMDADEVIEFLKNN